jgi:hypothetical protein
MQNTGIKSPLAELGLAGEAFFSAKAVQQYMATRRRAEQAKEEARAAELKSSEEEQIKRLMEPIVIDDERLANFMRRVRAAAEQGEHQILILRFPSAMCRDSGRAINNSLSGWEDTLVGVPQQLLQVWHEHLKPLGYRFSAEVLDYPDGMPGDIGLFCRW